MEELIYIQRKGGTVLINNRNQYHKVKIFKNNAELWRCVSYKKQKCRGNVIVKDTAIVTRKEHVCSTDLSENLVTLELDKLKNKVKNSNEPIPKLYKETCSKIQDSGLDLLAKVPEFSNIQHNLYEIRNKSFNVPKTNFKNYAEISIPDKFSDFVVANEYDEEEDSRIIILCTKEAKKNVALTEEFFGDGTFRCCPKPFYQLFVIHGEAGSSIAQTTTVPLIYVLMPDKKQETYTKMFQLISSLLPEFAPKKYHSDFELAAINGFQSVFPEAAVKGCYYHWSHAVWKKAKKMGISAKTEKRIVGLIAALPLLPAEFIAEGLEYAKTESREKDNLNLFFQQYIDGFWMTNKFNEMLCVYGERHRTNNVAEAYNAKLNKEINKRNASVVRLLTVLKDIESKSKFQVKKRRKTYAETDDDITHIQLQLISHEISVGYALEKLR